MQVFKLVLVAILCFAVVGPAHAKNTTPRGYINSTAKSLGNNGDVRTESGRKAWSKKIQSDAKNFASEEYKGKRKKHQWRDNPRSRNAKKQSAKSSSNSGVNE